MLLLLHLEVLDISNFFVIITGLENFFVVGPVYIWDFL